MYSWCALCKEWTFTVNGAHFHGDPINRWCCDSCSARLNGLALWFSTMTRLVRDIEAPLRAEIERLRAALEWYADKRPVDKARLRHDLQRMLRFLTARRNVADLVIVSMHEKGFPQADMYRNAAEIPADEFERMGLAPDDFFTMKVGDSPHDAVEKSKLRWPGSFVVSVLDDPEDDELDS